MLPRPRGLYSRLILVLLDRESSQVTSKGGSMLRNVIAISVLVYLTIVAFPVWIQSQEQERKEHEHMGPAQQVVRIGANTLFPEAVTAKTDEVISWINYSGVPVWISFAEGTVEKIRCKEPTRFHVEKGGFLTSGEVEPFEVAALCSFLPGEYRYLVRRQASMGLATPTTWESSGLIVVK
jgi:hypothetical protein